VQAYTQFRKQSQVGLFSKSCRQNQPPTLLQQLQILSEKSLWNTRDHESADDIDNLFTSLLLQAEKGSAIPINNFWNSDLHIKNLIYNNWITPIRGIKNKKNVSNQLKSLLDQMGNNNPHQGASDRSPIKQVRHARKALLEARNQSFQNQQVILDHLQYQRIESGKATEANLIYQIQKAEKRKQCWKTFKLLRNGPQTLEVYHTYLSLMKQKPNHTQLIKEFSPKTCLMKPY
jgi:hypothetical protein